MFSLGKAGLQSTTGFLIATSLLLGGCAGTAKRVASPSQSNQPLAPKITQVRDIGAMAAARQDPLKAASDGLIYPGEWLALQGVFQSEIQASIDSHGLSVEKRDDSLLLLQVPAGLSPVQSHELKLSNRQGTSLHRFHTRHYISAADTDDNALHFLRTTPDEKGYIEMDSAYKMRLDHKRVLLTQISPSHAFLYSIGVESRSASTTPGLAAHYHISLKTLHLAEAGQPKVVNETQILLGSQPVAVAMGPDNRLLLLGGRDLVMLDVSDELNPQLISRLTLPEFGDNTLYMDAIFLGDEQHLALLETNHNRVLVYRLQDGMPMPTPISQTRLYGDKSVPLLLDLEADPTDPGSFWVLAGANLRLVDDKARDLYRQLTSHASDSPGLEIPEQLLRLELKAGQLEISRTVDLPDNFVPFYLTFGDANEMYVSGFNGEFIDFDTLSLDQSLFKQLLGGLFNSVQFGRILEINPETADIKTRAQGLGLYYHVQYMPELGPIFALYKLSGAIFAPFVKVQWGLGVTSRGTFSIRKGSGNSIFPPYSVGHIAIQ